MKRILTIITATISALVIALIGGYDYCYADIIISPLERVVIAFSGILEIVFTGVVVALIVIVAIVVLVKSRKKFVEKKVVDGHTELLADKEESFSAIIRPRWSLRKVTVLLSVIAVAITAIILFVGAQNRDNYDEVERVRILRHGTMISVGTEYCFTLRNDVWEASIGTYEGGDKSILQANVNEAFVTEVKKILADGKVHKWNGFQRYNNWIKDGERFEFYMSFSDGKVIAATGYMAYPKTFHNVWNEFEELYAELKKEIEGSNLTE